MDEAELAFVATMRDEATRVAREAKAELNKLGGDTRPINVPVNVKADTKRARAEIKMLEAELRKADLGMDVDVNVTKAARVRLRDLKAELARLDHERVTATVDVNVKDASATLAEASRGVSTLMTAILLLAPAALPVLAAVTGAAGGLGAGLLAAAGGAGILGASVAGQIKGMKDSEKAIGTTQKKLAGLTVGTKEYAETATKLKNQQRGFNQTYGEAASAYTAMKMAWGGFLKDTKTQTLGVMAAGLRAATDVLKMIAPVSNAAAGGVRILIGEFRQWARGPEMKSLLTFFETEGPGMIVRWGHIFGNTILGVLGLFMGFSPMMDDVTGGLEHMTASFRAWSAGLDQNQGFQSFLAYARESLPQVGKLLGTFVTSVVRLVEALAPFSGPALAGVTGILNAFNHLPTPVVQAFGIALAGLLLTLKAYQLGVYAKTTADRIATVATQAHAGANLLLASGLKANAARLGVAAVGIAGVAAAAHSGGGAMGFLGGAASGALSGAALGAFGGPVGAAIGAGVGGLIGGFIGLSSHTKQAGDSAKASIGNWESLKATMDAVTGATTRATREMVFNDLEKSGALDTLRQYGITARDAVDAITRGGPARTKFVGELKSQRDALDTSTAAAKKYRDSLDPGTTDPKVLKSANDMYDALKKQTDARKADINAALKEMGLTDKAVAGAKRQIAATRDFTKAIHSLPPKVETALRAKVLGRNDVIDLTRRYKLVPKDVATLIRENGGKPTKAMVDRIIAAAKSLGGMHPNPKISARDNATSVMRAVTRSLRELDGQHATTYVRTVRSVGSTGISKPRARGGPVGTETSYLVGERGPELVTFGARGYVHDAVKTARAFAGGVIEARAAGGAVRKRHGKGHKPSKKALAAASHGRDLALSAKAVGSGLVTGLTAKDVAATSTALAGLQTQVSAYYKLRARSATQAKAATAAAIKSLWRETAAVKANAQAREATVNAIQRAKDLGAAAAETARTQGDISSIATVNDAPVTAGFITQGLDARVAALTKFQQDLAALRSRGLDREAVAELAGKGVDAAGAYASALVAGTQDQLRAVNKAQDAIRVQAAKIGADTTAGLAAGLASKLAAIDAAGVRLANALLKAVRKRLGIHSPSTEFYDDAVHAVAGQVNGLKAATPAAVNAGELLAARVQAAAVPNLSSLVSLANATAQLAPSVVASSSSTITIRHEVVSPDGSLDKMTADEIADLIARDPKAAAAIEAALRPSRTRKGKTTVTPSR